MPTITKTTSDHPAPHAAGRPRGHLARLARAKPALVLATSAAFAAAGATAAEAAVVVQCVPSATGAAVVSGGPAPGTCPANSTKVSLPAAAADQATLNAMLPYVSYTAAGVGGKPTIKITGANVQLVSGSGRDGGAVNAMGNLVIGYDETPSTQTGSHNLVLGTHQAFTSYGAIVGGSHNKRHSAHTAR